MSSVVFLPLASFSYFSSEPLEGITLLLLFPACGTLTSTNVTLNKRTLPTNMGRLSFPLFPYSPTHSATVHPHMLPCLPSVIVAGGHREDVTISWPISWTQAVRSSSPLPLSLKCVFCTLFPQWKPPPGGLDRTMCYWDYLGGIRDWTPLRPLCKLLRFWQAGVEICLSFKCPRQASCVSSLAY